MFFYERVFSHVWALVYLHFHYRRHVDLMPSYGSVPSGECVHMRRGIVVCLEALCSLLGASQEAGVIPWEHRCNCHTVMAHLCCRSPKGDVPPGVWKKWEGFPSVLRFAANTRRLGPPGGGRFVLREKQTLKKDGNLEAAMEG